MELTWRGSVQVSGVPRRRTRRGVRRRRLHAGRVADRPPDHRRAGGDAGPAGARALATARGVQCQANLRELGRCFRQYLQDNGNTFPPQQATGRNEQLIAEIAADAHLTPSGDTHAGGYHWSLITWQYHRRLEYLTCPNDPAADDWSRVPERRGSPFVDGPPESYGLNTLLFRMTVPLRRRAEASWGQEAGTFDSSLTFTSLSAICRAIPRLDERVLMFCGTSGFPFGHQSNVCWRDLGMGPANERSEWHPWPGAEPYADDPNRGSYYLFWSGAVDYRQAFPSRWEWALDLN